MPRFETPGQVALQIAVGSGKVEVSVGDPGVTEVEVVPLRDDEGTRRAAAETRVELVDRGDRQEILVEAPERYELGFIGLRRGPKLGIVVRCPSGADLRVKTASASVRASGTLGEVRTKTASGDVLLEDVRALDVTTASGDLTAHSVAEACSVKTASGDARLQTVGGALTVSLVSGDLQLDEAFGSVAVSTVSGDQRIGAVSVGPVKLSSVSGDVRVGVRPGLRLYLDVGTVGGTARSDLDADEPSAEGEGEVLELRVRTVSGDARIERAGATVGA